jgi:WS/DGAT/MGAT family acyltransferase
MTGASRAIERASASDRAFLAMDTGAVPEQFGVVLLLDDADGLDLATVRRLFAERIRGVPRLRQKLVGTPVGCGGPVWVDDESFDIKHHVRELPCRPPGGEPELLDVALAVVETPLARFEPLWAAVLVTDLAQRRRAVVLVLHHVLADGVGGLEVLANLVDPGGGAAETPFPRPRPTRSMLARDALRTRVDGLRNVRRSWGLLRTSMAAGGGVHPPRAAVSSLNRRTGPRRAVAAVHVDRSALRESAHRHGATTNDAVLVALAGALHQVLRSRGEWVDSLVVTVPVSGRQQESGSAMGNMVSPLIVDVPAIGDVGGRLALVAERVRADKAAATGPPPIAVLGWLFRPMARIGLYHWYMNHQHRFHVLASHVRGPDEPVAFGGHRVSAAIPLGVGEGGNATVYFEILSYAGRLTVTAIVDPDLWPDLAGLTTALQSELATITALRGPESARTR